MFGSSHPARRVRWLPVVVALLLVLGVAGVVTLVSMGSAPRAGGPGRGPTVGSVSPSPEGDEYGPAPDLCDQIELFAPVFDIVPLDEVSRDVELPDALYQRDCLFYLADGHSLGHLSIYAVVHNLDERARNMYREDLGSAAAIYPEQVDLEGDWDEGVLLREEDPHSAMVQLIARDGVLLLNLYCSIRGEASDLDTQEVALVRVAEDAREVMRR